MDRSRSWDCALMLRVINNTWKRINKYLDYPIKLKMKTKTLKFIGPAVLLIFSLFTLAILYLIIEIRLSKYSYHQKVNSRDFEVNSEISKLRFKIQNYRLSTMLNYLQIIQHYIYTDQNYKNHKINEMFWMYDKNTSFPEELFNKIFNINTIIESFSLFNPIIFTFNQIPFAAISKTNGTSKIHKLISSIQYTNSTISRMIKVDENIFNLLCNHDTNFSICYAFTFDLTQNEFISKEFETIHQFSNKKDIVESENLKAKYLFYKQEKSEFKKKYGKMLKNNKIFAWFKSNQKGRQKAFLCYKFLIDNSYCSKFDSIRSQRYHITRNEKLAYILFYMFYFFLYSTTLFVNHYNFSNICTCFDNDIQTLAHPRPSLSYLYFPLHSSELLKIQVSISFLYLKYVDNESCYPFNLFNQIHLLYSLQSSNDKFLISKCLQNISIIQLDSGFPEESYENLIKNIQFLNCLCQDSTNLQVSLCETLIDLSYTRSSFSQDLSSAYQLLKNINTEKSLFLKIVISLKLGKLKQAQELFKILKSSCNEEKKNYLAGLFFKLNKKNKLGAKSFFLSLAAQEFYNPIIRRWSLAELTEIFKTDKVQLVDSHYKQIVVLVECGLEEEIENDLISRVKTWIDVFNDFDYFSFNWFGDEVYEVFPLLTVANHKKIMKRAIKKQEFYGIKANLVEILTLALDKFNYCETEERLVWLEDQSNKKKPKKLVAIITTIQINLKSPKFQEVFNVYKQLKVNLILILMLGNPKPYESFNSPHKSIKVITTNSLEELNKSLFKIKSLISS